MRLIAFAIASLLLFPAASQAQSKLQLYRAKLAEITPYEMNGDARVAGQMWLDAAQTPALSGVFDVYLKAIQDFAAGGAKDRAQAALDECNGRYNNKCEFMRKSIANSTMSSMKLEAMRDAAETAARSPRLAAAAPPSPTPAVVSQTSPVLGNGRASTSSSSAAAPATYRDSCSDGGFTMSVVTASGRSLQRDAPFNRVPKSVEGAAVCNLEQYFGKDPIRQRVADFHTRTNYSAPTYTAVVNGISNSAGIGNLGEDFTLTGPSTDFTFKARYRYRDFKGCGTCAPGSTVSVTADVAIEGRGTLGGQRYDDNYNESITFTFVVGFITP